MRYPVKCTIGQQVMGWIPSSDLFTDIRGGENTEKLKSASGKTFRWYFLPLLLAILLHLWIPVVEAADVKLIPRLAVGGAYDDNIFLSKNDKVSSSIFTVSPSVELDYQTLVIQSAAEGGLGYPELFG